VNRDAAREMLGLSERPTVVYVGRLVARKGCDTLVEAFALLPRRLDARLVIVGGESGGSPKAARLGPSLKIATSRRGYALREPAPGGPPSLLRRRRPLPSRYRTTSRSG
jgi:glycosyltransferase involved in cell wall biosynthesis